MKQKMLFRRGGIIALVIDDLLWKLNYTPLNIPDFKWIRVMYKIFQALHNLQALVLG